LIDNIMKRITYNLKQNFGYSILEVMIAFVIITVGMVSVLALADRSLKMHQFNKNTIIASQLAQEGLELVRNKRDENWLREGYNWKTGQAPNSQSDIVQDGHYTIDYTGAIDYMPADFSNSATILKINSSGLYSHSTIPGNKNTIFSRIIEVSPVDDTSQYLDVKSTVKWNERGFSRTYIAQTQLYNWR